jgi:hypothetical protein
MALTPFSSALLQRFSGSGTDSGSLDNTKRTPPLFIGGHEFTIILRDTAVGGVQSGMTVQVNNSNPIDPNKKDHAINPIDLAIASKASLLIDSGAWGGNLDQTKESSASAADFNLNWLDLNNASIDTTDQYVGSGAWRYIRLTNASDINTTLSAWVYARDFSTNF